LTEDFQKQMCTFLIKKGIKNFVGVPDSTLKSFIQEALQRKKIIITTREEEAIGIATGMLLANSPSLVFMQNAGFANSLSTITSLVQLYEFPILFLIGWRGFKKNDAPEHKKIGKIQPKLLNDLELNKKILSKKNWKSSCSWAIKKIQNGNSCALIMPREFVD
tara:strand:- start:2758 stop:3246 length:489 start_codon:yes stop_codon:yes gene_type:complete